MDELKKAQDEILRRLGAELPQDRSDVKQNSQGRSANEGDDSALQALLS
jgi:hypothetical protein